MKLNIRSHVVDIRTDQPLAGEDFLVDTNAWYWLQYPNASHEINNALNYQINDYPNYLKSALLSKSSLHTSPLCFSELAHNIEDAECRIYADKADKEIKLKVFRYDYPNQRARVAGLITDIWQEIKEISTITDLHLSADFVSNATANFKGYTLDGYDLFMVEHALSTKLTQVITDDADYSSVPGITVFTANRRVISEAQKAGKLISRQQTG